MSEKVVEDQIAGLAKGPSVGTPEQIVEGLKGMEKQGMTYAITYFTEAAYDTTGIQLFENEVMPELLDQREHGHLWHLPSFNRS